MIHLLIYRTDTVKFSIELLHFFNVFDGYFVLNIVTRGWAGFVSYRLSRCIYFIMGSIHQTPSLIGIHVGRCEGPLYYDMYVMNTKFSFYLSYIMST